MRKAIRWLLRLARGIAPVRALCLWLVRCAVRLAPAGRVRDVLIGPVTTYLLPPGYRARVTLPDGTHLLGGPLDIVTRMLLYFGDTRRGCWEPVTTRLALALGRTGGDVIVGGAHVGYFAIRLARAIEGDGRVYAFEPAADMYSEFMRNLALNDVPNLVAERTALGARPGAASLYVQGVRSSLVRPRKGPTDRREVVDIVAIDDYVERRHLDRVALLLLDIEGAELQALQGAERLLRRPDPPDVLFEVIPSISTPEGSPEEYLRGLGYTIFYIEDDYDLRLTGPNAPIQVRPMAEAPRGHRYFNAIATRHPARLTALGVTGWELSAA